MRASSIRRLVPWIGWPILLFVVSAAALSCTTPIQTVAGSVEQANSDTPIIATDSSSTDDEAILTGLGIPIPMRRFVMTSTQHTTPQDVILELSYVGAGGPGASGPQCRLHDPPMVVLAPEDPLSVWDVAIIRTCGWQSREHVIIELTKPNGKEVVNEVLASEYGSGAVDFRYVIGLDDPLGQYSVSFIGENGRIAGNFIAQEPGEASIAHDGEAMLLFHGFFPRERVRLFAYILGDWAKQTAHLIAWQEYRVDKYGRLFVLFNSNTFSIGDFIAIGDVSGEVRPAPASVSTSRRFSEPTIKKQ